MKSQPTSGVSRFRGPSFILFPTLLLSLFLTGNVVAAKGGKPKPPPGPVVESESLVRWGGNDPTPGVLEANYRPCTLTDYASDMSSGTYTCGLNGTRVFYDFANFVGEVAHTNGDDSRCTTKGSQYYIEPDLEYSFSWVGDCTSVAGCDVVVVNRFTDVAVLGGPVTRVKLDPSLDRLTFEGIGRISNSTSNPFDMQQSVTIDYFYITFFGTKGKNKKLAECRAYPVNDNYPVKFETRPVDNP